MKKFITLTVLFISSLAAFAQNKPQTAPIRVAAPILRDAQGAPIAPAASANDETHQAYYYAKLEYNAAQTQRAANAPKSATTRKLTKQELLDKYGAANMEKHLDELIDNW